jgi:hypothetical protein
VLNVKQLVQFNLRAALEAVCEGIRSARERFADLLNRLLICGIKNSNLVADKKPLTREPGKRAVLLPLAIR